MREDCSVQTGPAQENALFCHQYYIVTDEPAVITGRLKITFLGHLDGMTSYRRSADSSSLGHQHWTSVASTSWNMSGQSPVWPPASIHLRRCFKSPQNMANQSRKVQQSNHMQSLNCYAHDCHNISDFLWTEPQTNIRFKQTTVHVCLAHEAHALARLPSIGLRFELIGLVRRLAVTQLVLRRVTALLLRSFNEMGEHWQCLCHDNNAINPVAAIS